jgi:hypothetical protein
MKHKLIKTDNYLLVVDESEIKEGDYYLFSWMGEQDIQMFKDQEEDKEKHKHFYNTACKKIIAHLPLDVSPILEAIPLLPSGRELIFETIGGSYGLESIDEHDQVDGYFDTYKEAELALFKNITEFETEDVLTPSEIFYPNDVPYSSPKTITTAQGIQWVGKYK